MARAPRKKKETGKAPAAAPGQPRRAGLPRFRIISGADGAERAERTRTANQGARDQALADFYGAGPELPSGANMRSMESLLGEVLESLNLQENTIKPEVLAAIWEKAVGARLASFTELQSVAKGSARVWVSHPMVRYELTRLKPQLVKALNSELGEGCVKTLRIVQ